MMISILWQRTQFELFLNAYQFWTKIPKNGYSATDPTPELKEFSIFPLVPKGSFWHIGGQILKN